MPWSQPKKTSRTLWFAIPCFRALTGSRLAAGSRHFFSDAVKIIIMTGKVDAVDAGRAREAGADDYVVKTAMYDSLLEAIKLCQEKKTS